MWYRVTDKDLELFLKIKPNAKKTAIVGAEEDHLIISLHAPPVDGAANKALIQFLAEILEIPKSRIKVTHGENSRIKRVTLPSSASIDRIKILTARL